MDLKIGLVVPILASLLVSIFTYWTMKELDTVGPAMPVVIRYLIQAIISMPLFLRQNGWIDVTAKQVSLSVIAGSLCGIYLYLGMNSMNYILALRLAAACQFQTIVVLFISRFLLKEVLTYYDYYFIAMIFFGIVMDCQPLELISELMSGDYFLMLGYAQALTMAVLAGIVICLVRKLKDLDIYFLSAIEGMAATFTVMVLCYGKMQIALTKYKLIEVIALGFIGGLSTVMFNVAYQLENPAIVNSIYSTEIFFTAVIQSIFEWRLPPLLEIFSCSIILVGVVGLSLR